MSPLLRSAGAMGWHPDDVRRTSLAEYGEVVAGFLMARGVDPDSRRFGRADLERLKKLYAEQQARQA